MSRDVVLVAGSANLDFVVRAAHVPAPGETILGRDSATFPGGKGANQAVASARAGGAVTRMLLALGNDAQATPLEDSLRAAGVDCRIKRSASPTGVAFICVADNGENAITVAPGANMDLAAGDLPALDDTDCLLLQLESPLDSVAAWAQAARAAGVRVLLNAAPAQPLPRVLLDALDVLIVNEGELAIVSGVDGDIRTRLAALDVPCTIVTLGALGACAVERGAASDTPADRWHLQPGFAVTPVDTTAAGDTFAGTLAAAFARGLPLRDGLRRACAAGALACTRAGAQSSIPSAIDVDALLAHADDDAARARLEAHCNVTPAT